MADYMARTKIGREIFEVEKWGDVTGYFVPAEVVKMQKQKSNTAKNEAIDQAFGMYANRKDWKGKSTVEIVQEMRDKEEEKYANLLD
jgi:hypothetical protein